MATDSSSQGSSVVAVDRRAATNSIASASPTPSSSNKAQIQRRVSHRLNPTLKIKEEMGSNADLTAGDGHMDSPVATRIRTQPFRRSAVAQKSPRVLNGIANTSTASAPIKKRHSSDSGTVKFQQNDSPQQKEKLELIHLIQQHYAILSDPDANPTEKQNLWAMIFDECKRKKHQWTKATTWQYLRKSKWPNIKRDALMRHDTARETDMDRVVWAFVGERTTSDETNGGEGGLEEEDEGEEEEQEDEEAEEGEDEEPVSEMDTSTKAAMASAKKINQRLTKVLQQKVSNGSTASSAPRTPSGPATRTRSMQHGHTATSSGPRIVVGAKRNAAMMNGNATRTDSNGFNNESELKMTILAAKKRLCKARVHACDQEAVLNRAKMVVAEEAAELYRLESIYLETCGHVQLQHNTMDEEEGEEGMDREDGGSST